MCPSVKQRIIVFGVFVKIDKVHRHMIGLQRREQVDIFLAQGRIENVQSILFPAVSVHDQGINRGGERGHNQIIFPKSVDKRPPSGYNVSRKVRNSYFSTGGVIC